MRKILWASFIAVAIMLLAFGSFSRTSEKQIYTIKLSDDIINPVSSEYISSAIEKAANDDAKLLIIELDTPGGLLTSTRKIVKDIMSSKVPIIVYISPSGARAGSAGVFITLAANIAAMAPSTNIGAAHPVTIQQRRSLTDALEELAKKIGKEEDKGKKDKVEKPKEPMEQKVLNDTLAWVQGIAKERGRNVDWAMKAVTESVSVSDEEALQKGVINLIARDIDELLEKIDGESVTVKNKVITLKTKGFSVVEIPRSTRLKILSVLAIPNIAYILLMLGFYGLLFEFTHPGIGFPGVAGLISIIVALYGLHLLNANYAGIALIVLGIILLIMEVRIVSYGLLTVGGVLCLFLGSLMLFDSPYTFMRASIPLILAFTLGTIGVALFLVTMVVRSYKKQVATGMEGMINARGEVTIWNNGSGKVFVHGEIWNAACDEELVMGDQIEVVKIEGMKLFVKKLHNSSDPEHVEGESRT